MSKTDRILSQFPAFYGALQPGKLLYEVASALAQPLEEADTHLFRIQRAHRLRVAENVDDIVGLARVLNLDRFIFEDLLDDKDLEYAEKLACMRRRVERIAQIYLRGPGTPWAILEMAAVFLEGALVPERPEEPIVRRMDPAGYSHQAAIEFKRGGETRRSRLVLHENPFRRRKVEQQERWPLNSWKVENVGPEASPARLVIHAVDDRTVRPMIFSPDAGQGIQFDGPLPSGSTLVIDAEDGATLDGRPVDNWIGFYQGGFFDYDRWDEDTFVCEILPQARPFTGVEQVVSQPVRQRRPVPLVPTGGSEWVFNVTQGIWNGSHFDRAVYAVDDQPVGQYNGSELGWNETLFAYPASGAVGMAWDERLAYTFKLLLPPVGSDQPAGAVDDTEGGDAIGRITALLPRFKATGVRAYVDRGRDQWILGESVIRSAQATGGDGLDLHATRLQDQRVEQIVMG